MDEEQQYERFNVDNDYEGGEYIGDEFFHRGRKQKRQQTKEDQLYGVFAEGSDSDEDRRGKKRERKDYSNKSLEDFFISKGIANKPPQENAEVNDTDQRDQSVEPGSEDVDNVRPSFASLRPSTSPAPTSERAGLGAPSAGLGHSKQTASTDRNSEDDEAGVLPTQFGQRIKERAKQRQQAERKKEKKDKEQKQRQQQASVDPNFGKFEQYTKGIGLKLLMGMGYKPGEGLGKDKSGIAKPIEAKLRPKNAGLGVGSRHSDDEQEARAKAKPQGPVPRAVAEQQAGKMWKKKNADVRVRREYKTASQVLESTATKAPTIQPILDMRGPQARLVTNMEHLNVQEDTTAGEGIPMPELQHNIRLLVDLSEVDIQKIDAQLRHEQDSITLLTREKGRLEEEALQKELQLRRMTDLLEQVTLYDTTPKGKPSVTLTQLEEVYTRISKEYREEYMMYNLAAAALMQALPHLQTLLRGWQPLENPTMGTAEFRKWRTILDPEGQSSAGLPGGQGSLFGPGFGSDLSQQDPYTMLVTELVLPPLRTACTAWEPRNPEPLLTWMDVWEPLLPHAALSHILDMLVMPALRRAVTEWEPRQEKIPIHVWLHPWLHLLRAGLEELYPVIRGKLSMALQAWHPSDGSALVLLRPWHAVFDASDWEALLLSSIIPTLHKALAGFVVNPAEQDMSAINWVMAWADVMPAHHMANVLDAGFFPKWHQVLHYWLSHSPNYEEVTRWYLGWKAAFPPALLDQKRIRKQFNAALDMMNSAVDGHVPLPATLGTAQGVYTSRWATEQPDTLQPPPAAASAAAMAAAGMATELTLKDLVTRFAADNGISFLPKPNRFQDGLQVYAFGNTSIVLDNTHSSIRALVNHRWAPVTLEGLLQSNAR